ncbi:hypothetical protein SAMN04515673_11365 [Poseidonocella sedimentorum]|uniref:Uncharacterized protein n=1 Tax=Poseidonocella sedimentorum TaxID=871652 RepID=A0A1I6EKA8_9RHOB|nr:hypothetical protein SAMN04515673_11365 [Poseidonocella sedimentorum]
MSASIVNEGTFAIAPKVGSPPVLDFFSDKSPLYKMYNRPENRCTFCTFG